MSALEIYFPEEEKTARETVKSFESLFEKAKPGLVGFMVGAVLTGLIIFGPRLFRKKKKKKR